LHKKLVDVGYEVYVCDYSMGTHHYQIEKGKGSSVDPNYEWHEYGVNTKKKVIQAGADGVVLEMIKQHYESQGYIVNPM